MGPGRNITWEGLERGPRGWWGLAWKSHPSTLWGGDTPPTLPYQHPRHHQYRICFIFGNLLFCILVEKISFGDRLVNTFPTHLCSKPRPHFQQHILDWGQFELQVNFEAISIRNVNFGRTDLTVECMCCQTTADSDQWNCSVFNVMKLFNQMISTWEILWEVCY